VDRQLFEQPALEVAPLVLGAVLSVGAVSLRVTEVEAYLGDLDPGSHAFRGQTRRNSTMFGEPGHLYTYFTYGMHVCANIVCSPVGEASGILLRAGRILSGIDIARERRTTSKSDDDLARGPARLAVALGITLADDGTDLATGRVRLDMPAGQAEWASGPRTGVSGDGGTNAFPWRFWIPGDTSVSPYRAHVPKRRRPN
jgi:DNA-3-methyladenine glycosylase